MVIGNAHPRFGPVSFKHPWVLTRENSVVGDSLALVALIAAHGRALRSDRSERGLAPGSQMSVRTSHCATEGGSRLDGGTWPPGVLSTSPHCSTKPCRVSECFQLYRNWFSLTLYIPPLTANRSRNHVLKYSAYKY